MRYRLFSEGSNWLCASSGRCIANTFNSIGLVTMFAWAVCQSRPLCHKSLPHSTTRWNTVTNMIPSCSICQELLHQTNFTLIAPVETCVSCWRMLFILELPYTHTLQVMSKIINNILEWAKFGKNRVSKVKSGPMLPVWHSDDSDRQDCDNISDIDENNANTSLIKVTFDKI